MASASGAEPCTRSDTPLRAETLFIETGFTETPAVGVRIRLRPEAPDPGAGAWPDGQQVTPECQRGSAPADVPWVRVRDEQERVGWVRANYLSRGVSQVLADEALERAFFSAQNREREQAGLAPLAWDEALAAIARGRSQDMARRRYFSHTPPQGPGAIEAMRERGILFLAAAENLALNNRPDEESALAALQGLMGSPGHRANILNGSFDRAAVGVRRTTSGIKLYTTLFIATAKR